jgi:hypothetical protein
MSKTNIIFLHGFASSSSGAKSVYLSERFRKVENVDFRAFAFTPNPIDFECMTITGMVNRLRQYVLDNDLTPFFLVGSSFGALVGMNYADRFGGISGSLLLAPALSYSTMAEDEDERKRWREEGVIEVFHYAWDMTLPLRYELEVDGRFYENPPPPSSPVTIVHGKADEVVPAEESRRYAAQYPEMVDLIEVEAGHNLNNHLDFIGQLAEELAVNR